MNKLLIVNNNMKVGGVQKSLYNLLWSLDGRYEVSLYLFKNVGEYAGKLPKNIEIIEDRSLFSYLGCSQADCAGSLRHRLVRGALAAFCRVFGRHAVMKLLLLSKKSLPEEYDCAIAYLHNGNPRSFYGGVQDFVLHRVKAKRKVAFLHCDYAVCGANSKRNNCLLDGFDVIAACSEGCREAFVRTLPEYADRCVVVRNCHRFDQICTLAEETAVSYDPAYIHALAVCRMAHEKGVERILEAARAARDRGYGLKIHLVGDGAMMSDLKARCTRLLLDDMVTFYGEQSNPYAYMKNADLLLVTSYHEAAPLVIEEAACLCLPILSVRTTSSFEMIERPERGWVCANDAAAFEAALLELLAEPKKLWEAKERLKTAPLDNGVAVSEFAAIFS